MRRSRMALALGLVLLMPPVLSGCSEDPVPKVAPSESPSVSESPAGDRSQTSSPRADQADFLDGYFKTISDSISTGDPEPFMRLSASTCQSCQALERNLRGAYADGGYVKNGLWKIASRRFVRTSPSIGSIWNVDVQTHREVWFDGSGEQVKIVRAGVQHFGVALRHIGGEWRVGEMRLR